MAARRPTKIQLERLEQKYTLGDYLASGGCGTVLFCTKKEDPDKKKYVLKYINLGKTRRSPSLYTF